MIDRHIKVPMTKKDAVSLKAGDYIYLTGIICTARDATHRRMDETLDRGEKLPFNIKNNIIYHLGPSPVREGGPVGSAGPTTASRMDKYAPRLLDMGMGAVIGKGKRSQAIINGIVRNKSVCFVAVGGVGTILSKYTLSSKLIAYGDLRTEAICKLEVRDFPMVVVINSQGNNLYGTAVKEYCIIQYWSKLPEYIRI